MTVACVVRSSVDCNVMALTTQSSSVIFGKLFAHPTHCLIFVSSLKHVERTNHAAIHVANAVCSVCASCCTSVSCCFISATSCVFFCRFSAVFTICIIDVSVFEQNKQFCVHHATTHALSLHPLSCLLRVVV